MGSPPRPKLRFLHSTLNPVKLAEFRRLTTEAIKLSLSPDRAGSLKVRSDGTVLDGHHRLAVLLERGEDVEGLQREIMVRERYDP